MTESLKKILQALEGEDSTVILPKLYEENDNAKTAKNRRLAQDLNNLIFFLSNPGVKPGGVKPEDLEAYQKFKESIKYN
ncbi:MAG: hypothetical protein ACKOXB_14925 [Flavobacteriales bacterium]